jgi:hypothetical protein
MNLLFTWIFLPKLDLAISFEVLVTKKLNIQYFPHLRFENYKINSIKS